MGLESMLRVMWLFLFLGLAPTAVARDASAEAGDNCNVDNVYSTIDILDKDVPAPVKARNLEAVKRLALETRCSSERYLLGLLHRHGPDLPGNPIPKDVAEARRLIEGYALEGNLQGFADLAEMALEQEHAREAMQWTQVYLYLITRHGSTLNDFERSGYNADLLQRAQVAWRKAKLPTETEVINTMLNAYLQPRKAELAARFVAKQQEIVQPDDKRADGDELRAKPMSLERPTYSGPGKPGYAVYLLEVQPDGKVSRIVLETFAPSPEHGSYLRRFIEDASFYPFAGNAPQIARIPVRHGYVSQVKLKKNKR